MSASDHTKIRREMGVKDFNNVVTELWPQAYRDIKMAELANKSVAIDMSILVYKTYNVQIKFRQEGELKDKVADAVSAKIATFKKVNCNVIAVFDGPQPDIKIFKSGLPTAWPADVTGVPGEVWDMVRNRLISDGVSIIDAPAEAEAQCAVMCKSGIVWGVVSTDTDVIAFGADRLLVPKTGNKFTLLDRAGITLDDVTLRRMCVILGNDYNRPSCSAKTLLKYVKRGDMPMADVVNKYYNAGGADIMDITYNWFANPLVIRMR